MNIDNLTFDQLKEIAAMFSNQQHTKKDHPFVGKYVIARCYAAGVHAGEVMSADGEEVILKNSRRLWSWKAKDGIALSGVAQNGIKSDSKVDTMNPLISLTGVCELIVCSDIARKSING